MLAEDTDFIDVEVHGQGCEALGIDESIHESIHDSDESIHGSDESIQWFPAAEAKCLSGSSNQSCFQRSIKELEKAHSIPLPSLRRGTARHTEYSGTAIALVKLLNSIKPSDRKAFESLKQSLICPPTVGGTGALTIANKNNQVARQCDLAADENFKSAKVNLGNAMAHLRELGRSYGKKAVNEFKAGFGEEVAVGLEDLGIQAENVFDVEN